MDERTRHWERIYRERRPEELSWYQAEPRLSLELIRGAGLAKDAPVLDVGGGASTLVDALLREGYRDLTVLDLAAAALRHAQHRLRERAGEVEWLAADVTRFEPPRRYALWHDRAVFHFLTEADDRARYVAALERSLLPAGRLVLAAFDVGGPERCSGLPVRHYDAARLLAELGPGFRFLEERAETHTTPTGARQAFCYFCLERSV